MSRPSDKLFPFFILSEEFPFAGAALQTETTSGGRCLNEIPEKAPNQAKSFRQIKISP